MMDSKTEQQVNIHLKRARLHNDMKPSDFLHIFNLYKENDKSIKKVSKMTDDIAHSISALTYIESQYVECYNDIINKCK